MAREPDAKIEEVRARLDQRTRALAPYDLEDDYDRDIPYLLKRIEELETENEQLRSLGTQLREDNQRLRRQIGKIYVVWEDDYDTTSEMHGIFAALDEALQFVANRQYLRIERYALPFRDGDMVEEVWPEDGERQ